MSLRSGRSTSRNLAPSDPQAKFDRLASLIVNNIRAPDILSVEEVQDNSGAADNGVVGSGSSTRLLYSPGRIDPTSTAWQDSRKPLAGEFMFEGHHLFVIANHFNSKGGDDPLEGRRQRPIQVTAAQRYQQAQVAHDFVAEILAADPSADVVVEGDLSDFEFSETISTLEAGVLTDLIDTLPLNERYSYVFEGNSQTLDHALLSKALLTRPFSIDVVHVNAEFADQASDHDPSVVRLPFYTFTSLCTLGRSYSTDASVADGLCDKLVSAGAATGKARSNILSAFRNQLQAQTGRSITADQAAILLQLLTELPSWRHLVRGEHRLPPRGSTVEAIPDVRRER